MKVYLLYFIYYLLLFIATNGLAFYNGTNISEINWFSNLSYSFEFGSIFITILFIIELIHSLISGKGLRFWKKTSKQAFRISVFFIALVILLVSLPPKIEIQTKVVFLFIAITGECLRRGSIYIQSDN